MNEAVGIPLPTNGQMTRGKIGPLVKDKKPMPKKFDVKEMIKAQIRGKIYVGGRS